jgi:hypothetical protein
MSDFLKYAKLGLVFAGLAAGYSFCNFSYHIADGARLTALAFAIGLGLTIAHELMKYTTEEFLKAEERQRAIAKRDAEGMVTQALNKLKKDKEVKQQLPKVFSIPKEQLPPVMTTMEDVYQANLKVMMDMFPVGCQVTPISQRPADASTSPEWHEKMDKFIGQTATVTGYYNPRKEHPAGWLNVKFDSDSTIWCYKTTWIVRKTPDSKHPSFKVGDKVEVVSERPVDADEAGSPNWCPEMDKFLGKKATVCSTFNSGNLGIKFDHDPRSAWTYKPTWLVAAPVVVEEPKVFVPTLTAREQHLKDLFDLMGHTKKWTLVHNSANGWTGVRCDMAHIHIKTDGHVYTSDGVNLSCFNQDNAKIKEQFAILRQACEEHHVALVPKAIGTIIKQQEEAEAKAKAAKERLERLAKAAEEKKRLKAAQDLQAEQMKQMAEDKVRAEAELVKMFTGLIGSRPDFVAETDNKTGYAQPFQTILDELSEIKDSFRDAYTDITAIRTRLKEGFRGVHQEIAGLADCQKEDFDKSFDAFCTKFEKIISDRLNNKKTEVVKADEVLLDNEFMADLRAATAELKAASAPETVVLSDSDFLAELADDVQSRRDEHRSKQVIAGENINAAREKLLNLAQFAGFKAIVESMQNDPQTTAQQMDEQLNGVWKGLNSVLKGLKELDIKSPTHGCKCISCVKWREYNEALQKQLQVEQEKWSR